MRVFVIGGTGLVGSNIGRQCENADIPVRSTSRAEGGADVVLDKTDTSETRAQITEYNPDIVIDTAAYHAVDDCEHDRDQAWSVNATGTRNVAVAADAVDAHLIFLSSDYVFSGSPEDAPYHESDPIAPCNYYGETKYAAEQAAKIANRHTILRPSVIYGLASDNFATWALGEFENRNEIGIVDDQTARPTYAPDLSSACLDVADKGITGLYHATGPESLSRYEFTIELANAYDSDPNLVDPITTEELGQEAPRPEDSSLDSSVLYQTLGYEFRTPGEAVEDMRQ
jgi:dTDP-4-dehydrorhamnose reductase